MICYPDEATDLSLTSPMVSGVTLSPAPSMPDDESSTSDAAGFSREGNGAGATTSLGATLGTSLGTSLGANKEFTNPWAYISTSPSATSTAHPHAYHPYRSEILPATLTAVNHSAPTATALSTVVPLSLPGMLATPPDSVGSTHTSLSSDYSLSNSPPAPSGTFVPGVGSIPNWTYAFHGPSSSIGSISCLTSGSSMASILGQPGVADLKGFEYVPRVMNNAKLGAVFTSELALSDDEQGDDQADSVSLSPNSRPLRDEMRRTRIQSEQRRRNELREGFDRLRDALPPSNQRVSKANILDRAVQHIQHLTEAHRWLVHEHERVKRHEEELLRQHKRLTETVLQHSKQPHLFSDPILEASPVPR